MAGSFISDAFDAVRFRCIIICNCSIYFVLVKYNFSKPKKYDYPELPHGFSRRIGKETMEWSICNFVNLHLISNARCVLQRKDFFSVILR